MTDDPVTRTPQRPIDVVLAGHRGDAGSARAALSSSDPAVRAAALGAVARLGALEETALIQALADDAERVRRRACDLAASFEPSTALVSALRAALFDPDVLVVVAGCWALGELCAPGVEKIADRAGIAQALSATAIRHADSRAREAAVAALGALGHPNGLRAVLDALDDKPTVRRRAVAALAAFEGAEAAAGIERSLSDRDWQVREVAEILHHDLP